jgi:hypothetical protein
VADVADGREITLSLPTGREVDPGESAQDWFKLLVSETPLHSDRFVLPPLGEPLTRAARRWRSAVFSTPSGWW